MTDDSPLRDVTGTIVGARAGCVVVQLDTGEEVLCRGLKRLHRPLGFYTIPRGRRARISFTQGADKTPLLIEVLND
jgi:hypothetical protein